MKRIFVISVVMFLGLIAAHGQIDALFDYKVYYEPDGWKPYVESYLSVNGESTVMAPVSNKEVQGKLGVVLTYEKNKQIINFSKFDLSSPIFKNNDQKSFFNLQRLTVDTGKVKLQITLTDLNGDLTKTDTATLSLNIPSIASDTVHLTDIELIQKMTPDSSNSINQKAGYNIMPKLLKYFPEHEDELLFYAECYFPQLSMNETKNVVVRYFIKPEGSSRQKMGMNAPKRITTGAVLPIIGVIDISTIPSGNYDLILEIINREQLIIATANTKIFRNNPKAMLTVNGDPNVLIKESFIGGINGYDTLKNYIDCLRPIADMEEKKIIDHGFENPNSNIVKMQLFFYNFWYARNSLTPSESWIKYREDVNRVDKEYGSSFRKGYESDRGITYLKYGPPNVVSARSEPSAYPYEIWLYQQILGQTNKRFVFYSPTLVANDYVLLHSDMQGEIRNPNWISEIYRRGSGDSFGSPNAGSNHWGTKAQELYNNPR